MRWFRLRRTPVGAVDLGRWAVSSLDIDMATGAKQYTLGLSAIEGVPEVELRKTMEHWDSVRVEAGEGFVTLTNIQEDRDDG